MGRKDVISMIWGIFGFAFSGGFIFCGFHYVYVGNFMPLARFILVTLIALLFVGSANLAILGLWKRGK
ncbi:hypothetical protein [Neisseria animaloris]|uniref:hypothetical protein n=1 Tax=Neisseria animaloris TaxID=326522 RepID=UPI00131BFEA3|nr:hypothetical protein [Neisseria animaloris]